MNRKRQRGQSMVEFTFVGIPLMLVLVSIFEVSRGMWMFHTAANAVKAGVRFATVHGENCDPILHPAPNLNSCLKTVADIAQVIQDAGVGLDINTTTLEFRTLNTGGTLNGTPVLCNLHGSSSGCQGVGTTWPPVGANQVGSLIEIKLLFNFNSAIAFFWPGSRPQSFGQFVLGANSRDQMQF